ncbi:winged helix-turn-helix transcriptional regulator, partial [Acinetobacter baumannii]
MKRIRGNDYSTVADAAESLGISVATLNRYIR